MLATAFADHAPSTPGTIGSTVPSARVSAPRKPRELADALVVGSVRALKAREHLFCEGDNAGHVYQVETGHVCIYRMMPDGRRLVIDFAYPGDFIGLGSLDTHTANAQATTRSRLRCVPVATLHEATRRDSALGLRLYEALSKELLAAREHLFAVSKCTATERVAAFLLALSRRNERRGADPAEIVLPMTRTDIADFLGLTIETVSRTFSKFRADGLIEIEHCILVTIKDAKTLACIAAGASVGAK